MLDDKNVAASVRLGGAPLYHRRGKGRRLPASNQKLLVTMALFDTVDPTSTITTTAAAEHVTTGTVRGDLWLIGGGDPSVAAGRRFARTLSYRPTRLKRLARQIRAAGITRITGSVRGDVSAFGRDWWATGWRSYYPQMYVPLPSALNFNGNATKRRHITDPEARAARSLTRRLRALGVSVRGAPSTGSAPRSATPLAAVESVPLVRIVRHMNQTSSNFHAEVLGKYLDAAQGDDPVSIAGGAAEVQAWAADQGVTVTAHDASGLSWSNRVSTRGMVRLLDRAADTPVRTTLARPGKGTLSRRLDGVRVRAKTGTLPGYSALSGYVYLQRRGEWASFSILCQAMSKQSAVALEDRIVRLLAERAR